MLTIPGVETVHGRSVWEQPQYRVAALNPPQQIASRITQPTAHYTSAVNLPDGDLGEFEYQIAPYLAAIQRDYWNTRKYSIGYLFAVDWLGGVWELRGFDYKSAANSGHNEYTAPILFLVDGADEATPLAVRSAVAVWREFRRRSGRADFRNRPLGHGELYLTTGTGTPTACPGGGLLRQLHRGDFDLDRPAPSIPHAPIEEDDDMKTAVIARFHGLANSWLIGVGAPVHLTPELYAHYKPLVPELVQHQHAQLLKTLMHQCGLGDADLVRI